MKSFVRLMLAGAAAVASPAVADEANPDADRLLRVICYGVATGGDPSTRDPDFTIVVAQQEIGEFDASYFIEGNRNFNEMFVQELTMTINIYHDTTAISTDEDFRVLAEELLGAEPTYRYEGTAERFVRDYGFALHRDGRPGLVSFRPDEQEIALYSNNDEGHQDQRRIYCEPPYSVEAG